MSCRDVLRKSFDFISNFSRRLPNSPSSVDWTLSLRAELSEKEMAALELHALELPAK